MQSLRTGSLTLSCLSYNEKILLSRVNVIPAIMMEDLYVKSFVAKQVISIVVNLRYLRLKLVISKENDKKNKICGTTVDHNFNMNLNI